MKDIFDLTGQVAIVTGASSGLGVEFAKALASKGANVVIIARREEKLKETQKIIKEEYGMDSLPLVCDLTDEEQIKKVVQQTIDKFGHIDILVNNAGYIFTKPTPDITKEEWDYLMNINLGGVFLMTKYVVPYMMKQKYGRIINIGSMNGLKAQFLEPIAPYCASKGAIVNLTKQWAAEFAPYNITCNSMAPGMFPTEMMDTNPTNQEALKAYLQTAIPMGRMGDMEEVHSAIIWLASPKNSYMTGQTIPIDGGMTAI